LIVEDNKGDVFLIRESMQTVHLEDTEVHVVNDGDKAVQFFEEADRTPDAPVPDLVILDINLPKRQGREVIAEMRQTRRCAYAKVLVVTSSDSDQDREEMRRLGVEAYFRKPSDYEGFMKLGEVVNGLLESGPHTENS
jgi:two-component system, chemotaxis family, response regulator Rcp1